MQNIIDLDLKIMEIHQIGKILSLIMDQPSNTEEDQKDREWQLILMINHLETKTGKLRDNLESQITTE